MARFPHPLDPTLVWAECYVSTVLHTRTSVVYTEFKIQLLHNKAFNLFVSIGVRSVFYVFYLFFIKMRFKGFFIF